MKKSINIARQNGVALLFGLIMLMVMTVLGISSFQNSHIQERAAGNARLQSVAFEAAAAGTSDAINFFSDNHDLGPDQLCGTLNHEGWDSPTDWVDMGNVGEASLKQRMYCLADSYPCTEDEGVDCDARPPRSQLFVLSRGEVLSGGNLVAMREIEVRLDIGNTGATGDGCGAICFPTCNPGTMNFPNSNTFQVDGSGGYAVTGGCQAMTDAILDGIAGSRVGNYLGGIATATPGAPWTEPATVEAFRTNIQQSAMAAQANTGVCQTMCYAPGDHTDMGNSVYGTVADPQITYVEGNASFGGDISGAGIMFVNGTLQWNGTPNFKGLIVTLGGSFVIDGGGVGGDHAGAVVILNSPGGDITADFGPSGFGNTGGGTALYKFNCDALWGAHALLDASGQSMWTPECDTGPGSPYDAGPGELIVASWRENIGWRDEFFGSDDISPGTGEPGTGEPGTGEPGTGGPGTGGPGTTGGAETN
ncbi:MAG TPA: PilX N-terminal domain-containing pilus assembly protein [Xanthomonadales bacterium]|nr:PilX N-terminal domain-containing pilus assembly protein [Xanthomonadales bacterium]